MAERCSSLSILCKTGIRDDSIGGANGLAGFHPNESCYLSVDFRSIEIRSLQTNVGLVTFLIPGTSLTGTTHIRPFALGPKGNLLAAATPRHSIVLWDAQTGEITADLLGAQGEIASMAFAPNGHLLATTSSDGSLRIWHSRSGAQRSVLSSEPHFTFGSNALTKLSYT